MGAIVAIKSIITSLSLSDLQRRRSKRMLIGSGLMMTSSLVHNISRVIMVAFLARLYTREEFGVWATVTSVTAIMVTSDFGIGNALRNKLSALFVQGTSADDEAREYFLSVLYFFLILVLLVSSGLFVFGHFIPLQSLFKSTDPALQKTGSNILLIVQFIFLIGIPISMGSMMFFAYQETAWNAVLSMAYGLLSAAIVCGLALSGRSITSVAVWYFLSGLLVNIVGTIVFIHRRGWNPFHVNALLILPRIIGLLSLSLRFAIIQISGAFIFNAATLVITSTISVGDAAEYSLVQKLYVSAVGLYVCIYNPLWAGYADAAARGDWEWCRRTLWQTLMFTFAIFIMVIVVFTLYGNFFLQVLAGKSYVSQSYLFFLIGIWAWLYCSWSCTIAFQVAVGRVNLMIALSIPLASIMIPFARYLGMSGGIIGVATASALIFSPLALITPIEAFSIIRRKQAEFETNRSSIR